MTERQARDEGAFQTRRIMDAVKDARLAKRPPWSAQQLADAMTRAGVPWNADIVVNLEHGRRKSLRVHELLALCFVLDVPNPLDVLIPGDEQYPVVPELLADPAEVRAWLRGESGPLRQTLAGPDGAQRAILASAADLFEQQGRPADAAVLRRMATLLDVAGAGTDGQG